MVPRKSTNKNVHLQLGSSPKAAQNLQHLIMKLLTDPAQNLTGAAAGLSGPAAKITSSQPAPDPFSHYKTVGAPCSPKHAKGIANGHGLSDWMLNCIANADPNIGFSVVRVRLELLPELPLDLSEMLLAAGSLTSGRDMATVLMRIAEDRRLDRVTSGQCGLQAGLSLIDAGDTVRGWNVIQRSVARMSDAAATHPSVSMFRTIDWLAIASGALAVGDIAATEVWWNRAVKALQQRAVSNVLNSGHGQQLATLESCGLMGDVLVIQAMLQFRIGDLREATQSLDEAVRFHHHAADTEAAATDLTILAALHAAAGDIVEATTQARRVRHMLLVNTPAKTSFRTSVLMQLLSWNSGNQQSPDGDSSAFPVVLTQQTPSTNQTTNISDPVVQQLVDRSAWN